MATRREKHPLKAFSATASPSDPGETAVLRGVTRISSCKTPLEAIEAFFDLAVDEMGALRTRAELDAIEREDAFT